MESMILKPKRPWRALAPLFASVFCSVGTMRAQTQNQVVASPAATPAAPSLPAPQPATAPARAASAAPQSGMGQDDSSAPADGSSANRAAADAFARTGVYVAPDMVALADAGQIEAAVKDASVPVNVAVVGALPPPSTTVAGLARSLHYQLHLGQGLMIVVCDRPRALGLYGGGLDAAALGDIAARTAKTFDSEGYAAGVTRVISLVSEEDSRKAAATRNMALLGLGIPAALLFWYLRRSRRARFRAATAARNSAETDAARLRVRAEIVAGELNREIPAETDDSRRARLHGALDSTQAALVVILKPVEHTDRAAEWDAMRAALRNAEGQIQRGEAVLAQVRAERASAARRAVAEAAAANSTAIEIFTGS